MFQFIRNSLFCFLLCFFQSPSNAQKIAPEVKRILFLGNSITWQGNYVNDIEAYFVAQNPDRHIEFINVGLPSETVSGLSETGHAGGSFPRPDLHERLERILIQTKPDLVFACYGMNDGIYLPFDISRFQKFKDGISWMHTLIIKTGARLIHLTPPDYDELKGKNAGYAAVLDRYSDWLLGLRSSAKWEVIDIHYPMKNYLEAHRRVDTKFSMQAFSLAPDGVHPGETGHWIIARQVISYLGYKEAVNSPGIIESLASFNNGEQVLKLIVARQAIMRDSWLTATRHKRPGLPTGLPLHDATENYNAMDLEMHALIENKRIAEVYLIGGQSNATGQGYMANMSDSMKMNMSVWIFHSGKPHLNSGLPPFTWQPMHQASESPDRFGPELGFASKIKPVYSNSQLAIIKHAHSGTNLYNEWNPGQNEDDTLHWGGQFKEFVKTIKAGLDSLRSQGYEPLIKGLLWQQGEAEAYSPDSISQQYAQNLQHFIIRMREQVGAPQMIFVYGYVCPPPLNSPGIKAVRQAQHDIDQDSKTSLSVNRSFVIQTDDLSHRANDPGTKYPEDHLHFGTQGIWELGRRMAEKINSVQSK